LIRDYTTFRGSIVVTVSYLFNNLA
jgi:hypothetical protein